MALRRMVLLGVVGVPLKVPLVFSVNPGGEVCLVMDRTDIENRWSLLLLGASYKKRVLPLSWQMLPYGSSSAVEQMALLWKVKKDLPASARIHFYSFPDWYPFNATRIEVYGSEGFMLLGRHGGGWQAFDAKGRMVKADKMTHLESQQAHIGDFLNCVRTRESPKCDIEEGHISSTLCHLGNISCRVGNRRLVFDPKTETFPGDAEANRFVKRSYRHPWVVPDRV